MSKQSLYRQLGYISGSTHVEAPDFTGKEFRIIRFLLRLLSLWRPHTAGFIERFVYPFLINIVLLVTGPVRNIILVTDEFTWLSIRTIFIVHELGIWLGHILGNIYFRSRDLETNVLPAIGPLTGTRRFLKRRVIRLNAVVIISFLLFSIMLPALFIVTQLSWNQGENRFSSGFPNCHGTLNLILYVVDVLSIFPNLGIGLALSWTMALLHVCFTSQLKALEGVYLEWKKSSTDAVYFFQKEYSRPLKHSWKRISWWFLAHNIVVVAVPLYGYGLALVVSGKDSKHLLQFICYFVFVLIIWLSPIVMAEQIKHREKKFRERVNEFSLGLLKETLEAGGEAWSARNGLSSRSSETTVVVSSGSGPEEHHQNIINFKSFTLVTREKDLKDFLHFLKNRPLGLVSNWYSVQLNLSLISFIFGIVSFLFSLHREYCIGLTPVNGNLNSTFT